MNHQRNDKWITLWIFLSTMMIFFLWLSMFKGCGIEPAKKTIIERPAITEPVPVAENPKCEGADGNPSRTLLCPTNQQGVIVEVCDEAGKWQVAANSCQPIAVDPGQPLPPVDYSLDYLETTELAHLTTVLVEQDRLNTAFINLSHAARLGLDMKAQYDALNRALNLLSFEQAITECKPIDAVGSVCAIDARDFGINEAEFQLIVDASSRPFVSKTTKGNILAQLTGKAVSTLHYDDIMTTVLNDAQLYNKLMGFETAVQVFDKFGINVADQVKDVDYSCVGTNESGISAAKNTRLACAFTGNVAGREQDCWITFDNPELDGADRDLFQSPFIDANRSAKIFVATAQEAICELPNQLHAYILFTAVDGVLQAAAPEEIVFCNNASCIDGTISTPSDCLNCHQDGMIPFHDVILPHVLSSGTFNAAEVELAQAIYLNDGAANELFQTQNKRYEQALNGMGIKFGDKNHLINTFNGFFRLQSKAQVAAYLMISEDALEQCINSSAVISGQIGALLTTGRITQETFTTAFNDILNECRINVDPLVRPN